VTRVRRRAVLATFLVAGTAIVCLPLYLAYFRYSSALTEVIAAIPSEERDLSPTLRRAIARVHPHGVTAEVAMRIVPILCPPEHHLARAMRETVWAHLLPAERSPTDVLALYAHFMVFEDSQGLRLGAFRYFGKPPSALSYRESLILVLIASSPRGYSPTREPRRLSEALARYGA
jgi:hypothetical protein